MLFTRPLSPDSVAARVLGASGVVILIIPTIEVRPTVPPEVRTLLTQIESFDWLFLTSANTVRILAGVLSGASVQFPETTQVCCVGTATAEACRREGWPVHLIPERFRAEEAVSSFRARCRDGAQGVRVLVPQGSQAGPEVRDRLLAMGATVENPLIYSTEAALDNACLLRSAMEEPPDLVVFSSPTTVRFFAKMTSQEPTDIACAVIGPVTARAARELGYMIKAEAETSTMQGLADAIVEYFKEEQ